MNPRNLLRIPWACGPAEAGPVIAAAIIDNVRHVRRVTMLIDGRILRLSIRPKWYAYPALGILHVWIWFRSREVAAQTRPEAVTVRVRVF